MSHHKEIRTLEEAEEAIKETPFLYLVSFTLMNAQHGSVIIAAKEKKPLYEVYFIFNEVNKEKDITTILNVIELT